MPTGSAFLHIWSDDQLRNTFLSYVQKDDLKSCRRVCKDFASRTAPVLFHEKTVTFRKGLFTSPSWLTMLDRLGPLVKTFHFNMPHSASTSLPPLIDDLGEAVDFVYEPYTGSSKKQYDFVPPYGTPELYDLLTKHYPTVFHAAANVPSFIRVFASLTNLKHLKISTPSQNRSEAYMRSAVDYALISVRIAIERNRLLALDTLSLLSVHPMAPLYLNPSSGFGARPNSAKRWKQIRNLTIHMDTPPTSTPADHLKILHSYLHLFSPHLQDFHFRWQGMPAPWPLSLHNEPTPQNQRAAVIYAQQVHLDLPPLHMPNLRSSYAENIAVDASQISSFVEDHHHMTRRHDRCSMDFEKSHLRSGTWDEALAPFGRISGADKWEKAMERAKKDSMEKLNKAKLNNPTRPVLKRSNPGETLELLRPVCYDPNSRHVARHIKGAPTGLHKAKDIVLSTESKTKELIHETEDRVKDMFRASIFTCWSKSRSPSVASRDRSTCMAPRVKQDSFYLLPTTKYEPTPFAQDVYLLPRTRYEGGIRGRVSRCA